MKKIYGIAFASAALMLASCSNESEPGGPNVNPQDGPSKYLAVNILTDGGTRADDVYEIGKDAENAVTSAKFAILSKYNSTTGKYGSDSDPYKVTFLAEPTSMNWTPSGNYPNTVEKIGEPVIVIPETAVGPGGANASAVGSDIEIVVLLNCDDIDIQVGSTTKEDLLTALAKVSKTGSAGSFQMSNSAYYDGTAAVRAKKVSTAYLMNSEAAAKLNPVDIYVERLAAAADVAFTSDYTIGKEGQNKLYWENDNKKEYTLEPTITGIYFYGDPDDELIVKNVENWSLNNMNDPANFRSYWATMPTLAEDNYTRVNFTNATVWDCTSKRFYLAENTLTALDAVDKENKKKATKVVVLAELRAKDKSGNPINIDDNGAASTPSTENPHAGVTMANIFGQFTSLNGAKIIVANQLNSLGYRIYTGTETVVKDGSSTTIKKFRTVSPNDLNWTKKATNNTYNAEGKVSAYYEVENGNGNRTYFELGTLPDGQKWAKFNGSVVPPVSGFTDGYADLDIYDESNDDSANALDDLASTLKSQYAFSYWDGGRCYYYVDINHIPFGSVNPVGVVRNHLYKINFTAINGFGTPVFNPDENIVPTAPEYNGKDKVALAARVNIHKWRIVPTQNAVLGK